MNSISNKIIIYLTAFFIQLSLSGCSFLSIYVCPDSVTVEKELKNFAYDIAKHPDKLSDLQKNYPQYFDPECMYSHMKDSVKVKELIHYIETDLKKECFWYSFSIYLNDMPYIEKSQSNCGIDSSNYYSFHLIKRKTGLVFDFYRKDKRYYLLGINKFFWGID